MTIEFEEDVRLLQNSRFRNLLESRLASQTATNAMVYAVLILLVKDSGSSIHSTLLVIALTVPSIVLGIPGGTLADILPRRLTMTLCLLARAGVAAALLAYGGNLAWLYLLVVVHATIGQLYGPAEAATVPAIARRDQLSSANSLMTLALVLSQIAGMVVIAPFLIKLATPKAVFIVSMVLFLVAAWVVGTLAHGFSRSKDEKPPRIGFMDATREGFHLLKTDRRAYLAMVYLVTATALSRVLVILLPKYTRDVLQIAPEDTVFVAAPAAIGAGLGLIVVPLLSRVFGAWRVVGAGYATFLLGLVGLGLVVLVRDFIIRNFDFGIGFVEEQVGVSSVITVTMLLAVPLGFAFTLVSVASRVVMNEQAPQEAQGRIFAVQMALADALSLAPLLLVGLVAEVVGARATLLASALAAVVVTGFLTSRRFGPQGGGSRAGPEPAPQVGVS